MKSLNKNAESLNWILKKINNSYEILSFDYPTFYKNIFLRHEVPFPGNGTLINWNKIKKKYSFNYENIENREDFKKWIMNTSLNKYQKIIVEFGYNQPIVSVEMESFLDNWYDFASYDGFVGIVAFTHDCKYMIEFSDRKEYLVYSNFKIHY